MRACLVVISVSVGVLLSSCSRKEDACIQGPSQAFRIFPVEFRSCSDSEYVLWTFSDNPSDGKEGRQITHTFRETGNQRVTQRAYSDDGRRTDETSLSLFIGYKQIDSVVVRRMSTFPFVPYDSDNSTVDPYMTISGVRSNETYQNLSGDDLPLVFTFNDLLIRSSNEDQVFLVDETNNGIGDETFSEFDGIEWHEDFISPQNLTNAEVNPVEIDVYWRLVP